jgi:hypothetical protein
MEKKYHVYLRVNNTTPRALKEEKNIMPLQQIPHLHLKGHLSQQKKNAKINRHSLSRCAINRQ